jgi:formylglycine-generating enzyme required for sulfatase activity
MTTAATEPTTKGMRRIPGGSFAMGSEDFYPEERPVRTVTVGALWMDEHPVTNLEFGRFVKATGYVTVAERPPDPAAFPGADPDVLVPGSLVFQPSAGPVDLRDFRNWWAYVPGAHWRRPEGPGSNLGGRERHPVVHVAHADADAYAAWAGKALPTEAEWEHAARGGLDGAVYAWGDEFAPGGRMMANTWQGEFPWQNLVTDGYAGTSPVGSYRPNGYGLLDMTGNVWEWTCDDFAPDHSSPSPRPCCVPAAAEGEDAPRKVIKGGSHLCAPSYCLRYRPAARQSETVDTGTSHIGFRCVLREEAGTP